MSYLANYLSAARILLGIIPYSLLLSGHHQLQLLAIIFYFFIGITDFLDGYFARRYGETKFGHLLDQIADKVYILFVYLPLSQLGFVPIWVPIAVLIRDPFVGGLRYLAQLNGVELKVNQLAKFKTALQLIGGAYIIWIWVVPDKIYSSVGMLISLLILLSFCFCLHFKHIIWHAIVWIILILLAILIRFLYPPDFTSLIYSLIIIIVTWLSAINYLKEFIMSWFSGKIKAQVWLWVINLLETIFFPSLIIILFGRGIIPSWITLTILFLEFLGISLNSIISKSRVARNYSVMSIKLITQFGLLLLIFLKTWFPFWVPKLFFYPARIDVYLIATATFLLQLAFLFKHGREICQIIYE